MNKEAYIRALEIERDGDWDAAHRIIQEINTTEAAWIHAYLHRVEGDSGNAAYWYRRAGRPECHSSLAEERQEIFDALKKGGHTTDPA
ncbi:hypothetical protein [Pontiella agarivorans]|uniref:Uncharacterized protein n=1 Tax=Pontiella agarivorans TaxID=3038953 RepID=A0ABU5N0F9_9BACT|nr:hypothetical protein [Pontiella agarivorans]MDZ8119898.1 hypothetical protein [Pontiella agarivorans]